MLACERQVEASCGGHGGLRAVLVELQHPGAGPSRDANGLRRRLQICAQRLERVRSLGRPYARIGMSDQVREVLAGARTA